jgi:hypothetical protein
MKGMLAILMAAGLAHGADLSLAWNPNPAPEGVSLYQVRATEVIGGHEVVIRTDSAAAVLTGLNQGSWYFVAVRAENAAGVSDYSAAVMAMPATRYRVTIQRSDALGTWTDTAASVVVPAAGAEFFRGKIEEVTE